MFLEEVWYSFFPNSEAKDENYRLHFVFDQDRNAAYRKYDVLAHKTHGPIKSFVDGSKPAVRGRFNSVWTMKQTNLSMSADYPEFVHYEGVIRLERTIGLIGDVIKQH